MNDPLATTTGPPGGVTRRTLRRRRAIRVIAAAVCAAAVPFASWSWEGHGGTSGTAPARPAAVAAASAVTTQATPSVSMITGKGGSGFGAPAVAVGLQANDRVATDPAGDIYVSSELDGVAGKIGRPGTWRDTPVNVMTSTPHWGGPYPASAGSAFRYSQVDGQYAMTWSGPTMGPGEEAGVQPHPAVRPGAPYTASITVTGSGQVQFAAGGVRSAVTTLSSTPQTLSVTFTPTSGTVTFQLWTPRSAPVQTNFTVTSYDDQLTTPVFTGATSLVAGNGNIGYSGDGGPASQAELDFPGGIAADASGDVYIADTIANVVRKVSPDGTITTVAGTGAPGYSGDGGPATRARLNAPEDVAVSPSGALFIADTGNDVIREVSPDGTIATVAGGRRGGRLSMPEGIAADRAGDVFIADTADNRVAELTPAGRLFTVAGTGTSGYSGDGGPAVQAELASPFGVAVDSGGDLYIADTVNNRIREVSPAGTISTLLGNGKAANKTGRLAVAEINQPFTVAVDNTTGDVYAAGAKTGVEQVTGLPLPSGS